VSNVKFLPDYAQQESEIKRPLKVGIKDIKIMRVFGDNEVLTHQDAYVGFAGDTLGIHMSRLASILVEREKNTISGDDLILEQLAMSHETEIAYWKCKWAHIFVNDRVRFDVNETLEGVINRDEKAWYLTVMMPYANVCPCSAEMVKSAGYGYPHVQRAQITVTLKLKELVDLEWQSESVIESIENVVKLLPEDVMKRANELAWCQKAYETKLFVEDVAKLIGEELDRIDVEDWVAVVEHFESIHNHNAVAVCRKGGKLL